MKTILKQMVAGKDLRLTEIKTKEAKDIFVVLKGGGQEIYYLSRSVLVGRKQFFPVFEDGTVSTIQCLLEYNEDSILQVDPISVGITKVIWRKPDAP